MSINNKTFIERFQETTLLNELLQSKTQIFLACSGGLDSMVLLNLLKLNDFKPVVLHCNFQLRGEESMRDEEFVKSIATNYGLQCLVKRFDTAKLVKSMGKGVQETARILRYQWFDEVLANQHQGKSVLMTAHHKNDQIETLLMNFFRGTGLAGMKGMSIRKGSLVRPLLEFTRDEILEFAHQNQINWVEDSSNNESDYTRNFMRNELIPQIESIYPAFGENLVANAKRFSEIEIIYKRDIEKIRKKIMQPSQTGFRVAVNYIKNFQPIDTILYELFREFSFSPQQSLEIKKLFEAETGRYIESETHRVLKNREWLHIDPVSIPSQEIILIKENESSIVSNDLRLNIIVKQGTHVMDNQLYACLDKKKVVFPLILRKWKAGDYFYPLGLNKKKKISRFLTDLKISRTEKENQWVIESDKKIIWVVGRRIDERYKVKSNTKETLVVGMKKST